LYPNNAEPLDSFFIVYGRNSYLKPISRQYFNELVDFLLKEFADSLELDEKPFWTSHPFRIGYITRLIKKKKISLHGVQRFVGHKNIQTTHYIPVI
jgi:site-specific recombinase XerD